MILGARNLIETNEDVVRVTYYKRVIMVELDVAPIKCMIIYSIIEMKTIDI